MNGRAYDPLLAQFLGPDPYIQESGNWQNHNRYAYCLNNPLKYTDPTGEFFWAAILIGAILNTGYQAYKGNIDNVGDFFLAAGIGGLAGAAAAFGGGAAMSLMNGFGLHGTFAYGFLGGASGSGFLGGMAVGAAGGFAGGLVGGAGNAWANGAGFGEGLVSGLKAGGIGAVTGGLIGGFYSGMKAHLNERDFWDGGIPMEERLKEVIEKYQGEVIEKFGDVGNVNYKFRTDNNIYTAELEGQTITSTGQARTVIGKSFTNADGKKCFDNNTIELRKSYVRGLYKNRISPKSLFHEYKHCSDLFRGEYSTFRSLYFQSFPQSMNVEDFIIQQFEKSALDAGY
jgi:hypothetical protein